MSANISEITPATCQELARFVAENAQGDRKPLSAAGGRTSLHFGLKRSHPELLLSTTELNDVIDYPSRDMTITLQAGMRMDRLQSILREENQQLPIDISQMNRATIGGVVATNTCGPRRFGYGTLRDYVIGISAVDAQGEPFSSGGRVVKNVAGYDLCKLLAGSVGTLAVITQLTLKLKPIPASHSSIWLQCADPHQVEKVLANLLLSETRPVAIEYLNNLAVESIAAETQLEVPVDYPAIVVMLEGTSTEVSWQLKELKKEFASLGLLQCIEFNENETERLLATLTEFSVYADAPMTFSAVVPSSRVVQFQNMCASSDVAAISHAGNGVVLGILPDSVIHLDQAKKIVSPLRKFAQQCKGSLTILECDPEWKEDLSIFGELNCLPLMRLLKNNLDPDNLFNPGCLFI